MGLQRAATKSGTIRALNQLIGAALLIPTLLFAIAAWQDRTIILEDAENDAVKLMAVFHEQAENLLKGHNIILDIIVNRLQDQGQTTIQSSKDLLHELETIDTMLDKASEILLVDASGITRATTLHLRANQTMPSGDKDCFLAMQRDQLKTCIGRPHIDPVSGEYFFSLARRLEKDGAFDGMAQVAISADYIAHLWASTVSRATDTIAIARADGAILAQASRQSSVKEVSPDIPGPLVDQIAQAHFGINIASSAVGLADRIVVFSKVADYPVSIILGLNRNAVLTIWYRDALIYALIASGASIGMVLALRVALRRARHESLAVARWQAEVQEREKTQEQLRQSQKMESLGKLTGGIAHDFNNLLTIIVGNISMVERFVQEPNRRQQLLNALKAGESAKELTQRLLAFARKQILQPQPIDLLYLVRGMEGLLSRTLSTNIRLLIAADRFLWPALIDPNQLELIILNLAINARDAMPDGGNLSITLFNREITQTGSHSLPLGQYVVLVVADTGIGMDQETLAQATEPFFTTKDPGKGTGLGLSMVQGVVDQSGGVTRLRSAPGKGTEVEIWLPRSHTLPTTNVASPRPTRPVSTGKTILVCDDNPAVLEYLDDVLKDEGYNVIALDNGELALSALQTDPTINLLILDFTMPGLNGAALAHDVQATHPKLPILLITGDVQIESIQLKLGDVPMLRKPFSPDQLTVCVSNLLHH